MRARLRRTGRTRAPDDRRVHAVHAEDVGKHRGAARCRRRRLLLPQRAFERAAQAQRFARLKQQRGARALRHAQPIGGGDDHAGDVAGDGGGEQHGVLRQGRAEAERRDSQTCAQHGPAKAIRQVKHDQSPFSIAGQHSETRGIAMWNRSQRGPAGRDNVKFHPEDNAGNPQ